jgi:NAD(P)-dependent dehydrogenase (short-subunit alcohol dehydrogenase family)
MSRDPDGRLDGKLALVTGAGSGIGRAVAERLGRLGAHVLLVGRSHETLESVAAAIRQRGGEASPQPGDITSPQDRDGLRAAVERGPIGLHVLVHSAGAYSSGRIADVDPIRLEELLAVNTIAPLALTRALLPMLRRAPGDVVFVNSSVVQRSAGGVAHYAATKHALRGIADALRDEVNAEGIRVLSVYAGRTATPMQERIFDGEQRPYRPERLLQSEDVARILVDAISLPRTAELTDLSIRPTLKS